MHTCRVPCNKLSTIILLLMTMFFDVPAVLLICLRTVRFTQHSRDVCPDFEQKKVVGGCGLSAEYEYNHNPTISPQIVCFSKEKKLHPWYYMILHLGMPSTKSNKFCWVCFKEQEEDFRTKKTIIKEIDVKSLNYRSACDLSIHFWSKKNARTFCIVWV